MSCMLRSRGVSQVERPETTTDGPNTVAGPAGHRLLRAGLLNEQRGCCAPYPGVATPSLARIHGDDALDVPRAAARTILGGGVATPAVQAADSVRA